MNILVIDVGGSHVKILVRASRTAAHGFGADAHAAQWSMASRRSPRAGSTTASRSAIPGVVVRNSLRSSRTTSARAGSSSTTTEAFGCPVRIVNDAAMQALGGYKGGKMLFLGFGTGLGTALIVDGILVPMELAHLPYKKATFEDYVGEARDGARRQEEVAQAVMDVIERLRAALEPEDVVLGGGNAAISRSATSGGLPPGSKRRTRFRAAFACGPDKPATKAAAIRRPAGKRTRRTARK